MNDSPTHSSLQTAIAFGSTDIRHSRNVFTSCRHVWHPRSGRLDTCLHPYVLLGPALAAGLILLYRLLRPLGRRFRPAWTQPFIVELPQTSPGETASSLKPLKSRKSWMFTSMLLTISAIGLGAELINALVPTLIVPGLFLVIAWASTILLIAIDRPQSTPYGALIIYIFIFIARIIISVDTASKSVRSDDVPHIFGAAAAVLALIIVFNMPMRDASLPNRNIASSRKGQPNEHLRSPEDNLTLLQFFTVSWTSPLIALGSSRQLHNEDVWQLPYQFHHRFLHDAFRELLGTPLQRLIRANAMDLIISTFLTIGEDLSHLIVPVLFQQLLRSMEDETIPLRSAVVFATLTLIARCVNTQFSTIKMWYERRCYERSRGEMITMLYEKTLSRKIVVTSKKKKKTADGEETDSEGDSDDDDDGDEDDPGLTLRLIAYLRKLTTKDFWRKFSKTKGSAEDEEEDKEKPASTGKLLNLMRNDVYQISERFWRFADMVGMPIRLVVLIILTWKILGWPCLIGVLTVVVAQLINVYVFREILRAERRRRIATDKKLNLISQFIQAIRHLRWEASQYKWIDRVLDVRQKELWLRVWSNVLEEIMQFVDQLGSGMFPVVSFWAYTAWAGQSLDISVAFPAIVIFEDLESVLQEVPYIVTDLLDFYVSIKRLNAFMAERDKEVELHESLQDDTTELHLENASFAWPGEEGNVLHDLNLSFKPGFTLIYGQVAAGKSALFHGLLGELDMRSGQYTRPSHMPVGYCSQTPWLQSMSIRDNILFSKPFEEDYYRSVLDACALTPDFASFKDKDLSNIGENGIGLSGGQRARIALARALYSQSKFLFLDDPLSALDQETAELIVQKCFKSKLLRDKVVVLATHRVDLCIDIADQIVEIGDGQARIIDPKQKDATEMMSPIEKKQSKSSQTEKTKGAEGAVAEADKFIEDEFRAHGGVNASIYWEYIKAGKLKWWLFLVFTMSFEQINQIVKVWFLKAWGESYEQVDSTDSTFRTFDIIKDPFKNLPSPAVNVHPWLIGFLVLGLLNALGNFFSDGVVVLIDYSAGKSLFKRAMDRVGNATFRFYDTTPVGRLMNRMTSDIGTIDGSITRVFERITWEAIKWVVALAVIASSTPLFLILSVLMTGSFVYVFRQFLPTSQSLRRLETVSLSPLMTNFGALVEGLTTVRAFAVQHAFQDRVIDVVDIFQKHDHFYWSLQAWLQYRLGLLSAASTFLLTLIALYTGVSPGLTAFVLSFAQEFVDATNGLCRFYGNLQLQFVSVERVVELLNLEQEPKGDVPPPARWPVYPASIEFDNVTIRYAAHLEPALKDISIKIPGGSNTALVGRTGSGKSTLAMSILGTIPPETGRILVQDIDVSAVEKQKLRQRLTFLPQDPMLLPGTMQRNLDPFEEQTKEACEEVLERICGRHNWTLDMDIEDGGKNLSQGQRQLVSLARAVLRRSAIVILDEATASIDTATAVEMQKTLREELPESTVITIAHRVEALSNSDYCVVLEQGRVSEQGPAREILSRRSGLELTSE